MEQILLDARELVGALHPILAALAVVVLGAVPFVESYFGTLVGALAGLPLWTALAAAVAGNVAALLVAATAGRAVNRKRTSASGHRSGRSGRIVERTEKHGVPIASLLAPTVFAISLTTFIMVSVGFDSARVVRWQIVATIAWGALTAAAVQLVSSLAG